MFFTTLITFIVVFGLLIFLHELGHFLTARKFGVRVEEFGFGLPPRMGGVIKENGKWKIVGSSYKSDRATIYSLNWIPFGGFVKMYGEEGDHAKDSDSFAAQPAGKRAIILSAGVVMNALLTVVLLTAGFIGGTPSVIDEELPVGATVRDTRLQIVQIISSSPAAEAGLLAGDVVTALNGIPLQTVTDFQEYTASRKGNAIAVTYTRDHAEATVNITPQILADAPDRAIIGVSLIRTGTVSYPWYRALPQGIIATGTLAKNLVVGFAHIIGQFVRTGHSDGAVSGPVGIAVLTGQVVQLGFIYLVQFTATLSLNLAILNYLPFPALDGGRVLFIIIEKLRGKMVDQKVEALVHTIGFALLLALIAFITYKDIVRFGAGFVQTLKQVFTG